MGRTAWPEAIPFRVQALAAAALAALFILWVRGGWGGEWATTMFTNLASTAVPAGAALACAARARRAEGLRTAWRLLALGCASWAAGQAWWTWVELTTGQPPATPSLADLGYLGFVPAAVAGVALFTSRESPRRGHLRPLLDGAVVGASFVYLALVLGLEPILERSTQADFALVVNVLYPFGDAVVLGIVFQRLARSPAAARPSLALLAAGVTLLAVADLWFLVVDAQGEYDTGGILDAFWIMGFQLIGLAATRPGSLAHPLAALRPTRALVLLPLLPFAVAYLSAMYAYQRDGGLSPMLFWAAVAIILLVLLRMVVMLVDNVDLTVAAERAAEDLRLEKAKRTRMMNAITHDMLNAMSPIRLQVHMLQRGMHGALASEQANAVAMVARNSEQIARLASDMKEGANVEEGRLRVRPHAIDLARTVGDAVDLRREEATQRGIALRLDAPAALAWQGDAGRLTQAMDNLLSNALKFTPRGGQVVVSIDVAGAEATVRVADSGRGLSPEERGKLFQPYVQVHDVNEIKEHGTGLGLFICRGIVEQHGGRMGVESRGHGQGSTFWLTLPAQPPLPAPAAVR